MWKCLLIRRTEREKGKGPGHSLKEFQHLEISWKEEPTNKTVREKKTDKILADCYVKKSWGKQ